MIAQNIDALVLGCTHYPYLISKIKTILGNDIKIIDSGEAVARQTKKILMRNNQLNSNKNTKSLIDFIPIKTRCFKKAARWILRESDKQIFELGSINRYAPRMMH